MVLKAIHLRNFRNHSDSFFEAGGSVNVFVGLNGEGKTNILEAISFLCLTKGLYNSTDSSAVQIGKEGFTLDGQLLSGKDVAFDIRVEFNKTIPRKQTTVNKTKLDRLTDIVGRFPLVALSPEHGAITMGPPAERRKFVDGVISQANRSYLETLLEYRRILRHRNKLLLDRKFGSGGDPLEPWDNSLIQTGARIVERRSAFLCEFEPYIRSAYAQFAGDQELPALHYHPSVDIEKGDTAASIEEKLRQALEEKAQEERRVASTLVGPHRDEIVLTLSGLEVRAYASQGQHKTFLVAMKIAEHRFLMERANESPILLLDDVFSELDEERSKRVLELIQEIGQTFITTVDDRVFGPGYEASMGYRRFVVKEGRVFASNAKALVN
ncbi:MAG TPA: DNA replication/repair protein RecF [Bacteroidota bacterium]|nr:DNA replication/repair protein RecF [Bacteroidota bacterium]